MLLFPVNIYHIFQVRPIYPHLQDHESVQNRETIRGVKHPMFLIDHQQNEVNIKNYLICVLKSSII